MFQFEGKTALVIGAGQGMGESSALLLAQFGCDVALVDVEADRTQGVSDAIARMGRKSVVLTGDVLDDEQIPRIVAAAEEKLGGIDILVSIVGKASRYSLLDMPLEAWDLDQRRNVRYLFIFAREVARSLIRRGKPGAIVCVASVAGLQSAPWTAAYGVAKAGLINLVKTMAVEWAQYGIRVNAIAPGSIKTPRFPDGPIPKEQMLQGMVPMKHAGTTDDIGKAVVFLASDFASYITGHTLPVDGGWMAAHLMESGSRDEAHYSA